MPPPRIAQQCPGLLQTPLQHVMGEALAGFFEQQVNVARRNAEQRSDTGRTQIEIAAAALDLAQDGDATRRSGPAFLRKPVRIAADAERESDQIDDVLVIELSGASAIAYVDIARSFEVTEQQLARQSIVVQPGAGEVSRG